MIEPFSAGYYLVDARVETYTGDNVAAPRDVFDTLLKHTELPVLKLGSGHYLPEAQRSIPAETIAVPKEYDVDSTTDRVLLARGGRAAAVLLNNDIDIPGIGE